jgi:hypothetical protein
MFSIGVQNNIYPFYPQYESVERTPKRVMFNLSVTTSFANSLYKSNWNEQSQKHYYGVQTPSKLTPTLIAVVSTAEIKRV